ncbi:helix-turn-helix domain-containing protein [Kribbella turkmenica]|uniref:Helix-turn-helix domain-containing protein n=1 Tax=Kribbella turkmenica TaxID=2530375 RepID=A0A4R4WT29_9ACTN|nr:helix-turn-helix domain-containing protein [Kribbella turkmenica]TDD20773.1 helix-turn-helix domain-containing protein [Kribbella turkmenica]
MRRYSNQPLLLDRLQKLAQSIALDINEARPIEPAEPPRVHKLDERLDSETMARIVAEYEAGGSSESIGALFRLSKRSVIKILREAGIKVRYPRMTEAEIRRATMLYNDGASLVEVGNRLGRDHTTIHKALKRHGVRMRDSHGRP